MQRQNEHLIERIVYSAVVLLVGVIFVLFYRRFLVYSYDIDYHRIFAEKLFHMSLEEMSQLDSNIPVHAITYPLYHLVLKVVAGVLGGNYHWASYLVLAGVNVLSIVLFRKLIFSIYETDKLSERLFLDFVSISAVVFVVARSPLTEWRYYAVQCAANPLHNPTILFIRPFGIIAFIAFALIMLRSEKGLSYGKLLAVFGASVFLSILGKPNFAFTFLPAMGLVVLIYMISKRRLKVGFQLLGVLIPSLILLLVQFGYVSSFTTAMKLQVVFGGFTGLSPIGVIMASLATFPVVLILFSGKEFKSNIFYRTSIFALVVGWVQMFFLTNGPSGDFSWGYDLSVQFATVITIACAMGNTTAKWRKYIGILVYSYQVICGVGYLILVSKYGQFLI